MELAAALAENNTLRETIATLRANFEAVEFQLAQLKRMIFGTRSELLTFDGQSGLLFEIEPPPVAAAVTRTVTVAARKKPVRERLPAHLPHEVVIIDLSEEEKACPGCAGHRHVVGELVSEKLDYVPATLKVIETRRPKYACRPCGGEIDVAPFPSSPIEQGMDVPGLLAHVLVSKFADHLPLNRQEAMLRRQGIELPRSTLCDWTLGAADCLRPFYMHLTQVVVTGDILHSDDTPVPLQAAGKTVTERAWSWVNPQLRLAVYPFTESRAGIHPQSFLST
jgi:transposase